MCGRFTLSMQDRYLILQQLGLPADAILESEYRVRYNVAPRQSHWIVRTLAEDREILPARWGLVNVWADDDKAAFKQINARSETVDKRPAYRSAFRSRRCVIPADGFFEWTGPRKDRKPLWFHRPDGGLILFAGLYEEWYPEPDRPELTFTIMTTSANATVEPVHDRMPVIVPDAVVDDWLFARERDMDRLKSMLVPAPDDLLTATPVSTRVNSVKNDDADCLAAPAFAPQQSALQQTMLDG